MTDDRDPLLQNLFADAQHELDGEAFTAQVLTRSRFIRYRVLIPWIGVALMLAAGAWFLAIPIEFAQFIAQVLTATLIDLGDSWLAWLFSPVNNIAAVFVLSVKAFRMGRKKIMGGPHTTW